MANTARTVSLNWRMLEKPAREGHLGHGQRGRLDQHPGRLGPLGPGEGDGPGADLGQQQALELAHAVAELRRPGPARPSGRPVRRR